MYIKLVLPGTKNKHIIYKMYSLSLTSVIIDKKKIYIYISHKDVTFIYKTKIKNEKKKHKLYKNK